MIESRSLRFLLGLVLTGGLALGFINFFLVSPLFTELLVNQIADEASRLAHHLSGDHLTALQQRHSSHGGSTLQESLQKVKKDFELVEIRFLLPDGEILCSSDEREIGRRNTLEYFRHRVQSAQPLSRLVRRGMLTQENRSSTRDVVESYIPLLDGGRVVGLCEMYHDVTDRLVVLKRIQRVSNFLPTTVLIFFLGLLVAGIVALDRALGNRQRAQVELQNALNEARNSRDFMRTVLDGIQDPICTLDARTLTVLSANSAFFELYGYTPDEVKGRTCHELTHGLTEKCAGTGHLCPLDLETTGGERRTVEHVHFGRNGHETFVEVVVFPIHDTNGETKQYVHVTRDITDRKKNDRKFEEHRQKLHKQNEELSSLLAVIEKAKKEWERTNDCMGEMVLLCDGAGRITRCNQAFAKFAGQPYGAIIGKSALPLLARFGLALDDLTTSGVEFQHLESSRWFIYDCYPYSERDEKSSGDLVITIKDISRQKDAENQLRLRNEEIGQHREKLQKAYDGISKLILRVAEEENFSIRHTNPNLQICHQIKKCQRTTCPCYGSEPQRCWQVAGTFCRGEVQGEFAQKYRDCTVCEVYKSAASDPIFMIGEEFNNMMQILEGKNTELQGAYEQLKNTHAQMLQQEKMASIGQLAAGVAHEINNPMGFITSNLGTMEKYLDRLGEFLATEGKALELLGGDQAVATLKKKLKIDFALEDSRDLLRESLDGAHRVREIVQNLKSFSRVDEAQTKAADINDCLETTLKVIWNELKYKVTLHKQYGTLPPLSCRPQQLNQVFMNLLVNGAQAIEEQGEITIRTWEETGCIKVAISDTGKGIDSEALNKIFEPFFTTKPVGKGTGLGLSICYDIVKAHGGRIDVESTPGMGSTFTVVLPLSMNH